jgi:phosphonate transport system substrate-binding protein
MFHIKPSWLKLCIILVFLNACTSGLIQTPTKKPTSTHTAIPFTPTIRLPTLLSTATLTSDSTLLPTFTITADPTSAENEITREPGTLVFGIINDDMSSEQYQNTVKLASAITEKTGHKISVEGFGSYINLLIALEDGKIDILWLPPFTYLLANQNETAFVGLISNQNGVYLHGTQFFAHKDSGFQSYYEPLTGKSTTDAATALRQFAGKQPCWVNTYSASGYILPLGLLIENKVSTPPGAITQSATSLLRALYVKGICDFGATFAISGDPRTSDVLADLTDINNKIVVIWRSEALIPGINLSFSPGVVEETRRDISYAAVDLINSQDAYPLFAASSGQPILGLRLADDKTYDALRLAIDYTQIDLRTLIGK